MIHPRNIRLKPRAFMHRLFNVLSKIWFMPFGFYVGPIKASGEIPRPLTPRTLRDLILNKMMFPDNIKRAIVADKIAARGWAAEQIGAQHIVPIYGAFNSVEEVRRTNFPYPYIVKTNHASALFAFVNNDAERDEMLAKIANWDMTEYKPATEWAYHDIKAKFIVEKLLVGKTQSDVIDVKLFCFFGEPVLIHYIRGRQYGAKKIFMTPKWDHVDISYLSDPIMEVPEKPEFLPEILRLAKTLSSNFDFIRMDFLVFEGQVFFGECTNFPVAGECKFKPHSFDKYMFDEYQRIRQDKITSARAGYHKKVLAEIRR